LTTFETFGQRKAVDLGGFEVLLAAVNNHLDSAKFCQNACSALANIVIGSKENTGLLISLGGAKWPDNDKVQTQVGTLANLIASEMKTWGG
jgi:hypothetical protein